MTYVVTAVDRALKLLEILAEYPDTGVSELAERSGNTKSLVFRLLYTLEQRGYVHKDQSRRTYSLGYRPLFLADHTNRQSRLIETAGPFLDALSERVGENVLLSVREGLNSVCIALRESPQSLRIFVTVGGSSPLHAGGGTKVLLAYAPRQVFEAVIEGGLKRYSDTTITDPAILESDLARIREEGVGISLGELEPGCFSIAAPIRDHCDQVVAAVSVTGPQTRLDVERYRDEIIHTANSLSKRLGYVGRQQQVG